MTKREQLSLAVLLSALCGCRAPDVGFGIATTLQFDTTVSDAALATVDTLDVTASGDESFTGTLALSRAAMRVERSIYRPRQSTRSLMLGFVARDGNGAMVASGTSGPLVLHAGSTRATTIYLARPGPGDGGLGGDGGAAPVVSIFAGKPGGGGSADGIGTAAFLDTPTGVAVDANSFYVIDHASSTLFAIDRASLQAHRVAGDPWRPAFGRNAMNGPSSAVALQGSVYITDTQNGVVRAWDGTQLTTVGGLPGTFGDCDSGRLAFAQGITTDGTLLYVVNNQLDAICSLDPQNGHLAKIAGSKDGYLDGLAASAQFRAPRGIGYSGTPARLYITDGDNRLIRSYTFASPATVSTALGTQGACGSVPGPPLSAATLCVGSGVTTIGSMVYFTDLTQPAVRGFDPTMPMSAVTVLAGSPIAAGANDGVGLLARFDRLQDLVGFTDSTGGSSLLVADTANHTVRAVTVPGGAVKTIAGSAEHRGSDDGTRATATFAAPLGLATDGIAVYVADSANGTIRKIAGETVSTAVRTTALVMPSAIAIDTDGTLYVTDQSLGTVVEVTSTSQAVVIGGNGTDLGGSGAGLAAPQGIAVDSDTLYVADTGHDAIRTFTKQGVLTGTLDFGVSGTTVGCATAPGLQAPQGLALDASAHMLYVAASGNCMIFAYDTVARSAKAIAGASRGAADGVGTVATFDQPAGIALDGLGHLFVTDFGNALVRRIDLGSAAVTTYAGVRDQAGIVTGAVPGAHLNRGVGIVYVPALGLVASMPSENSLVVLH